MILKIESEKTVSAVSREFSEWFPFLKLEFFKVSHDASEPSAKKAMVPGNVTIGKMQKVNKGGYLELSKGMTVQELEDIFRDRFGLNVQVFRSSGKLWLETSGTDSMTLSEQNELGREKSTPLEKQDLTDIDYD